MINTEPNICLIRVSTPKESAVDATSRRTADVHATNLLRETLHGPDSTAVEAPTRGQSALRQGVRHESSLGFSGDGFRDPLTMCSSFNPPEGI